MRLPEKLPELRGRWLTGYRALWWATLVLAVAALAATATVTIREDRELNLAFYGVGLRVQMVEDRLLITPVSSDPTTAGIAANSELLAVDGQPAKFTGIYATLEASKLLAGPDGSVRELTVRAPDGSVSTWKVDRSPRYLDQADAAQPLSYTKRSVLYAALGLMQSMSLVIAAILLFRRRAHDPVVALLAFGLLAAPASGAQVLIQDMHLRFVFGQALAIVGLSSMMIAMSVFPEGRFTPRWTAWLIPLLLVSAIANRLADGSMTLYIAEVALILALVLAALIIRFRRLEPGPQRQQIKWAVLGFAAMFVFGLTALALGRLDLEVEDNAAHLALIIGSRVAGFTAYTLFAAGLVISLLRHRLYDADVAISRSALYGGLTVALVAIFAGFEKLIETLGEEWYGGSVGAAAGALAAALAALFLVPLHHRMSHWAEKRFQQDIAKMRARLPELLAELRDSENPRDLADDALRLALAGVRANHGAIALSSDEGPVLADAQGVAWEEAEAALVELPAHPETGLERLDDGAFALRMPLLTPSGALSGWLLLGPHPDGSYYGKDDREALEQIASPLARALSLAMDRARRAEALRVETRALRDTLDSVARRLAEIADRIAPPARRSREPQTPG